MILTNETKDEILQGIIIICGVIDLKLQNDKYQFPPEVFDSVQAIIKVLEDVERECNISVQWGILSMWYDFKSFGEGNITQDILKTVVENRDEMLDKMTFYLSLLQLKEQGVPL